MAKALRVLRHRVQVVQFVPAVVVPQFLLCGLLVPRADMPRILESVSLAMPVTYAVDAMQAFGEMTEQSTFPQGNVTVDAACLLAFCVVLLGIASPDAVAERGYSWATAAFP